jgi:hypothetical protein
MNQQKLNELADLAIADLSGAWNIPDEFLAQYTELIVKECMQVAKEYQNRGGNCYVDNMIADHFGVEE